MMDIYGKSTKFKTEDGYTLESLCVKYDHFHYDNTPRTPLLYSKTEVYRGIHFFLQFFCSRTFFRAFSVVLDVLKISKCLEVK